MSNAPSNAPGMPQAEHWSYAELNGTDQNRIESSTSGEPHLTTEENVALSDAHVRGPQRMTRLEAIAAARARLAAVNAERKAKP